VTVFFLSYFFLFPGFDGSPDDADVQKEKKISPGVKFDEYSIEEELGKKPQENELKEWVKARALNYEMQPENASIDPVTDGIIPGRLGEKVDLEKTMEAIYNAGEDELVKPVLKEIKPDKSIDDLTPGPIYNGNPKENKISFICNVAWGSEYIVDLLDVLDDHQVKISFFLEGRWARNNPEKVRKIYQNGHEIGNHAYSHYNMSTIDRDLIKEEIEKANDTIKNILDLQVELFGPPAGDFDQRVIEEVDELGMYTILWSIDTVDWMEPGVENMVNKVLEKAHPGGFILMHPTEDTVKAIDNIIHQLKDDSFNIVPISKQLEV